MPWEDDPFDELPTVLSAPDSDTGFVRVASARWADLQRSIEMRDRVLADLVEETDRFARICDLLRPYMDGTDRTVSEALALARRGVS